MRQHNCLTVCRFGCQQGDATPSTAFLGIHGVFFLSVQHSARVRRMKVHGMKITPNTYPESF